MFRRSPLLMRTMQSFSWKRPCCSAFPPLSRRLTSRPRVLQGSNSSQRGAMELVSMAAGHRVQELQPEAASHVTRVALAARNSWLKPNILVHWFLWGVWLMSWYKMQPQFILLAAIRLYNCTQQRPKNASSYVGLLIDFFKTNIYIFLFPYVV